MLYLFRIDDKVKNTKYSHNKLFEIFKTIYGLDLCEADLVYSLYGKPSICTNKSNLKFSISHTNDILVICISKNEIGIDIEKVLPIDFSLITLYFSDKEREMIDSSNDCLRTFYKIWTCKEAYIKYLGGNIFSQFNKIEIIAANDHEYYIVNDPSVCIITYSLSIQGKYEIAICHPKNNKN